MKTIDEYLTIVGETPTIDSCRDLFVALMDSVVDDMRSRAVDDATFVNLFVHKVRQTGRFFDEELCTRNPALISGGFIKAAKRVWSERDVDVRIRRAVHYL
jgi:hypothetical protein